jgi:hypothetical protein
MSKRIVFVLALLSLVVLTACGTAATSTSPPQATAVPTSAPVPTIEALATQTSPTETLTKEPPAATTPDTADISSVFIQLADPLDEPQFYCLDVPGSGTSVRLQAALQVHTCKQIETAEDELFAFDYPSPGQIYMEAYDLCIEADGTTSGSQIFFRPCSNSPNQIFTVDFDIIRLGDGIHDGLCVAVDPAPGIPTGGPSHLRRDVTLQPCNPLDPAISRWIFGLFDY